MRYLLAASFALCLLGSTAAKAGEDVACINNNCFGWGWEVKDSHGQLVETANCILNDCVTRGWLVTDAITLKETIVNCEFLGCFDTGYIEKDTSVTPEAILSERSCMHGKGGEQDCLLHGWMDKFYEGSPEADAVNGKVKNEMTDCDAANTCEAGGWVTMSRGQTEIATCKPGGCFSVGWTTAP